MGGTIEPEGANWGGANAAEVPMMPMPVRPEQMAMLVQMLRQAPTAKPKPKGGGLDRQKALAALLVGDSRPPVQP